MNVDVISVIGHALGDRTRLQVLDAVDGRLCVGEIAARVVISSATASHHLAVLERGGLVELDRRGRRHVPRRRADGWRHLLRALG